MKIKKGDLVLITTGKDKGKTGKVERVFSKLNKVSVEGMNEFKRHMKARTQNEKSEIKTIYKPIALSNVALLDPKTKKPSRVGYKVEKGTKMRISKASGQAV